MLTETFFLFIVLVSMIRANPLESPILEDDDNWDPTIVLDLPSNHRYVACDQLLW